VSTSLEERGEHLVEFFMGDIMAWVVGRDEANVQGFPFDFPLLVIVAFKFQRNANKAASKCT
jgi:hypothetical protein